MGNKEKPQIDFTNDSSIKYRNDLGIFLDGWYINNLISSTFDEGFSVGPFDSLEQIVKMLNDYDIY